MLTNEEWKAEYGALIGLDWADAEHSYHLVSVETSQVKAATLPQTAEDIDEWASKLGTTYSRPVALCLEQSKGALMNALMKYPHIHLYPLDGKKLRRYRESSVTSEDRDDAKDAKQLWEYLEWRELKA